MSSDYLSLMLRVTKIVNHKNYEINIKQISENTYKFFITSKGLSGEISYVIIAIMNGDAKIHNLREIVNKTPRRSAYAVLQNSIRKIFRKRKFINKVVDLFHISSVFTDQNYRGNYFALLLFIYGISHLKLMHPSIKHATLDDCSDNSSDIQKNLYHILGFFPLGEVSLHCPIEEKTSEHEPTNLVLSGPEKQANLDRFVQRANDALTKVEAKTKEIDAGIKKNMHKRTKRTNRIKRKSYKHIRIFHRNIRTPKK
jgi:hypothetical protein